MSHPPPSLPTQPSLSEIPPTRNAPKNSPSGVYIVVPCYNEEKRLNIARFESYLLEEPHIYFAFVNDGSKDGTLRVLQELAQRFPGQVTALDMPENRGKAEAVRAGMLACFERPGSRYVGFWDADLATPLDSITQFIATMERRTDLDMVIGSRVQLLGRNIERKPIRHYLGRVFATGASLALALPIYDTQCGAKLFRTNSDVVPLFKEKFGSRWIFDVEIIARYLKATNGRRGIFELPLDQWEDVGDSRVRGVDFMRAGGELAKIYRTYRLSSRHQRLFDLATAPFVRYAAAGAVGTGLHYTTTFFAVNSGHLSPALGTAAGATVGAFVNYIINYHFTFASNRGHKQSLPRFLVVATVGVVLSGFTVKYLVEQGVHFMLGQVVATILVLGLGFIANKLWTFGRDA